MKFRILTEYDFDYKLFKSVDTKTTDFAKREGQGYEGWCVEEVDCNGADAAIYTNEGNVEYLNRCNPYVGIRPSTSRIVIETYGKTIRELEDGLKEIECGEYPQEKVEDYLQEQLNQELLDGKLNQTGRNFTIYNNDEEKPGLIKLIEVIDKDGNKYVNKENIWYKVSPVVWIVNEKTNLALTKYMIQGGIPYGEYQLPPISEKEKEYQFRHYKLPPCVRQMHALRKVNPTIIEGFLNVVLSKELIIKEDQIEKLISEAENRKEEKTEKPRRQGRSSGGRRILYKNPRIYDSPWFGYGMFTGDLPTDIIYDSSLSKEQILQLTDDDKITLETKLVYKEPEERDLSIDEKKDLGKILIKSKNNK